MKITETKKFDKTIAIVEGAITTKSDIDYLTKVIEDSSLSEVVFESQTFLPAPIVKILSRGKLKITPIKRQLWLYLEKLNIPNLEYFPIQKYKKNNNLLALGIGGSAGSIEVIIDILKKLQLSNISIFIVIHQNNESENKLVNLLQSYTEYKVEEAKNDMEIKEQTIYIAPSDYHMIIISGFIFLTQAPKIHFARPSISVTFSSLALEYQSGLVATFLSGYGNDGIDSVNDLHTSRSVILTQNPKTCEASSLPEAIIDTNRVDSILDPDELANNLNEYIISSSTCKQNDIVELLVAIKVQYGYDFTDYQIDFIRRRIKVAMTRNCIISFEEYKKDILSNHLVFEDFIADFSINVTEFFRDTAVFKKITDEIIPYVSSYPIINIWSAGCSSGEEAYSLAIILYEAGLLERCRIYATDFNETILNEAKNALYPKELLKHFSNSYKKAGGKKEFTDYVNIHGNFIEIKDKIKKNVLFFNHNLTEDRAINEFQVILCRNVMIYFNKILQEKVKCLLKDSLMRNGFLIMGSAEKIQNDKELKIYGKKENIYQRKVL